MKILRIAITGIILGTVSASYAAEPPASLSSVPEFINYQGNLVTPDGDPYSNTTHTIQLQLYDQASGGSALWGEEYSVKTQDGYFSVLLGSGGTPIEGSSSNDLWQVLWREGGNDPDTFFMGVTLLTDAAGNTLLVPEEASPRQQFVTSPFAFRAHQSVYATQAADEFQAPQGINTPSITSTSDVVVTASMRITGSGNTLHASEITAIENSELEIIGQPNKSVEVTADNGIVSVGYATPSGSPTVAASSVRIGYSSGSAGTQTYIQGEDVSISAKNGNSIGVNTKNGTVNLGYSPQKGSLPYIIPASGAAQVTIGYATTDVNIQSDNFDFNGLPLFDFDKVLFIGTGVSVVQVSVPGINPSQYDLMIVGYNSAVTPRSVFMMANAVARIEFPSAVNSSGWVRVLGIRKGLMSGFEY